MEQQEPNCFSADLRHQSPLDGLFGHQTHSPAGAALGRLTANHGDNSFLFCWFQQRRGSRSLLVIQRLIQAALGVATADLADSFGGERKNGRDLGSRFALVQMLQRQGSDDAAHRLNAATKKSLQLVSVSLFEAHLQTSIGPHTPI